MLFRPHLPHASRYFGAHSRTLQGKVAASGVAGVLAATLVVTLGVGHGGAQAPVELAHQPVAQLSSGGPAQVPAPGAGQNQGQSQGDGTRTESRAETPAALPGVRVYTQGVDFSQPVGMVVRLHGDGAYEYHNPAHRLDGLAEIAASHNKILVAPLTPDAGNTWWQQAESNTSHLRGVVDQVAGDYSVNRSDIWWMGYSGGAELLARHLILAAPELVTGGAIMLGGGGRPWGFDAAAVEQARPQVGPLTWITGLDDNGLDLRATWDALSATRAGAEWYRANGFSVSESYPVGVDHFELPHRDALNAALGG